MPQYKVKAGQKGFYKGELYDYRGKRTVLTTSEPLKPVPSWLEPIKHESKEAEKAAEKAAGDQRKAAAAAAVEQKKKDKVEIDSVTFTEAPKSTIETL